MGVRDIGTTAEIGPHSWMSAVRQGVTSRSIAFATHIRKFAADAPLRQYVLHRLPRSIIVVIAANASDSGPRTRSRRCEPSGAIGCEARCAMRAELMLQYGTAGEKQPGPINPRLQRLQGRPDCTRGLRTGSEKDSPTSTSLGPPLSLDALDQGHPGRYQEIGTSSDGRAERDGPARDGWVWLDVGRLDAGG